MTRSASVIGALAVGSLVLAGCASGSEESDAGGSTSFTIVTDLYPTTFAVEQVVGDDVEVIQLTPSGIEPHDYELSPQQVAQIADADLVAYLPFMVPAVQEAVEQEGGQLVDVSAGIEKLEGHGDDEEHTEEEAAHEGEDEHSEEEWDPHVWLDPANMAVMGGNVAAALADLGVAADASGLEQQMAELGEEMASALGSCAIDTMVVSHEAFAYLAAAHGFEQVGIAGLSPDAEPSPARLAEISTLVQDRGVTTIYFESLVSSAPAETIAAETGATTALLDPIEGNTDDAGYSAIMKSNTDSLKAGQSCS